MSAPHKHWPLNAKLNADITRRHRRWPLGTLVATLTPHGYLIGNVFKHWRKGERKEGCSVLFSQVVDMGDANGRRDCHVIPFRNLRKIGGSV